MSNILPYMSPPFGANWVHEPPPGLQPSTLRILTNAPPRTGISHSQTPTSPTPRPCSGSPLPHLLDEPLAALISSSARHSAMVLMLRNAASRAPVVSR